MIIKNAKCRDFYHAEDIIKLVVRIDLLVRRTVCGTAFNLKLF